jgi:hypothetical protein
VKHPAEGSDSRIQLLDSLLGQALSTVSEIADELKYGRGDTVVTEHRLALTSLRRSLTDSLKIVERLEAL